MNIKEVLENLAKIFRELETLNLLTPSQFTTDVTSLGAGKYWCFIRIEPSNNAIVELIIDMVKKVEWKGTDFTYSSSLDYPKGVHKKPQVCFNIHTQN